MITKGSGRRNSTETFDFLPGSAIRGALAGRYAGHFGVDDEFELLFERGIRFGNARPAPESGHHALLPLPRSTMRCKADSTHFEWDPVLSTGLDNPAAYRELRQSTPPQCRVCNSRLSYKSGWWNPSDSSYRVPVGDSTRTAMFDGTALKGALFAQSDIPSTMRFVADLVGDGDLLEALRTRLDLSSGPRVRLGRSKSTNGTVQVVACETLDAPSTAGYETLVYSVPSMGAKGLALMLASPAILLDAFMRPTIDPGIALPGYELVDALLDMETVLGWNSGQGLPKVPDLAVSAGSVFLYANCQDSDEPAEETIAAVSAVIDRGVGLRRQEGFGEVCVLAPIVAFAGGVNRA